MDAFVTKKKRKSSPETPLPPDDAAQEESTDLKLAILASLHPDIEQDILLDILLAHDGNVEATSQALKAPRLLKKPGTGSGVSSQASLRSFTVNSSRNSDTSPAFKRTKLLSRKGQTLHLYDPRDVSEHTPCTVIHNFLPAEEANALLVELLEESKSFEKITFKLFDNVVASPHTSGFYVGSYTELQEQKNEYVYNGSRMTVRLPLSTCLPYLLMIPSGRKDSDTPARTRQSPCPRDRQPRDPGAHSDSLWGQEAQIPVPRAVVSQRRLCELLRRPAGKRRLGTYFLVPSTPILSYSNTQPQHSDQLTYLGPRPIIGSLSLGVAREFRVRRILPSSSSSLSPGSTDPEENQNPDLTGQIAIHLPHNSLLIMHADMQETWKHSVSPAQSISPHPVAGNRRINITYRHYRAGFHPRNTPRCPAPCGVPAVLRVVTKKRENWGRYFWMCHAGNVPGKEECGFFRWAEFDEDGNPVAVGLKEGGVDEKEGKGKHDQGNAERDLKDGSFGKTL